jgi:hypothetical protein
MSFGKRADYPGGRRRFAREELVLGAAVMSPTRAQTAALMDVSSIGAKLHLPSLPETGKDVLIRIGEFEAFGTVVWSERGVCGVHFDEPVSDEQVDVLKRERGITTLTHISADDELSAQEWANGLLR